MMMTMALTHLFILGMNRKWDERVPMSMQIIFGSLFDKANEAIRTHSTLEQALAVRTSSENVYVLLNNDVFSPNKQAEQQFVEMLTQKKDIVVTHMIALWRNSRTDLPSYHFRNQLALLHTDNLDARIIMRDEHGYRTILLRGTFSRRDT